MQKNGKVRVVLTGGIGNQLFQYAFALYVSRKLKCTIYLGQGLGVARQRIPGQADLEFYKLSREVKVEKLRRMDSFRRKCLNFIHSKSLENKERNSIPVELYKTLANAIFSILDSKQTKIFFAKNLGFAGNQELDAFSYYIGYFQTFRYLECDNLLEDLRNLRISDVGPDLKKLIRDSRLEKPLIVHVRLMDYRDHNAFGILDTSYYSRAFALAKLDAEYKSIWVFSDDLELAKQILPETIRDHARFIGEVDNNPVATLEAMRLGKHYIIANSTFSWWAATLSENPSAQVFAPYPWFYGMDEPRDLIPPNWKRIARE